MSIFSRTRDIVAANLSDLLDRAEEPAKMVRLIIVEMEETLMDLRASRARKSAERKEMLRQIESLEAARRNWADKAETALEKGREDLARRAIGERQKAAELADELHVAVALCEDRLAADEEDIARLDAKLADARTRHAAILARQAAERSRNSLIELSAERRIDEALARFDLIERRADLAGERAALPGPAGPAALDEQIAQLQAADHVEAELAAMKAARDAAHL